MRARALLALAGGALLALAVPAAPGAHDGRAKMDKLAARIDADAGLPRDARVDRQPAALRRELLCLALNVYHEARGEIAAGRYAVAMVARNRADRDGATYCAVVWAPFQFSWTARPAERLVPREPEAWARSLDEACDVALDNMKDITGGASHFYDPKRASPVWAKRAPKHMQIGAHRYLRLARGEPFRLIPIRSLDTWT